MVIIADSLLVHIYAIKVILISIIQTYAYTSMFILGIANICLYMALNV